eukprot:CAMPEP_0179092598 /NCGR_PEP_ID=MMETSP0796-20121207/42359_1 /TAXON_ID=73915 /ORGANISM="Pyrodinium bahamense, Strain pbaha01" /LENGTH=187 /DNA_ID=CAMNT_0020790207 /DNA_START=57 /DNA_END=620 /DNA_ORIENTATION=-
MLVGALMPVPMAESGSGGASTVPMAESGSGGASSIPESAFSQAGPAPARWADNLSGGRGGPGSVRGGRGAPRSCHRPKSSAFVPLGPKEAVRALGQDAQGLGRANAALQHRCRCQLPQDAEPLLIALAGLVEHVKHCSQQLLELRPLPALLLGAAAQLAELLGLCAVGLRVDGQELLPIKVVDAVCL